MRQQGEMGGNGGSSVGVTAGKQCGVMGGQQGSSVGIEGDRGAVWGDRTAGEQYGMMGGSVWG